MKIFKGCPCKEVVFLYFIGLVLLICGVTYAIWQTRMLSTFLIEHWTYLMSRDLRWEQHIKGQAEITKEILRRLPDRPEPK